MYLLSVLTLVTLVIRWRRNLYGFCFNFFISLVLRSITWKGMCVCRCSAFKYQFSPLQHRLLHFVMGWTPGLVWSFLFTGWECTCCLHFPWSLYGITPTSPSAPVHYCILSCGSTLWSGFGFCSDRSRDTPTNFFLTPFGWNGWHLAAFLHCLLAVTLSPSLPFIFPWVLAPVYARITSL